jgi:type IV pilus assembly protein PilA
MLRRSGGLNAMTFLKAKRREEPGLTLIELLMVLVVIGVMVAIAIPQFAEHSKKAADKCVQTDPRTC